MPHDFEADPRFSAIPERMQQQLKELPFTAGEGTDDAYQEVSFKMGDINCQCAVLSNKWVMLPEEEIAKITGIDYVFDSDMNRMMPTPFPGLLDQLRNMENQ